MSTNTLNAYVAELFIDSTIIDSIDPFITTGSSAIPVVNKTMDRVGSTVQISNTDYRLYEGGFSKDVPNSQIDMAVTPMVGLQGVIPGITELVFDAYDTDTVSGVSTPRVCETHFWLGNPAIISSYAFVPRVGATAIPIFLVDNITSGGPNTSWFQLATCNASSVVGAYAATGVGITMNPLSASGVINLTNLAGDWSITLSSTGVGVDAFQPADYIIIKPGSVTSEIRRVASISGTTLNLTSGLTYNHFNGQNETVYACVREFAAKETVPSGATGGTAQTFYDMSLQVTADRLQRS